jgi:hypothetical protein
VLALLLVPAVTFASTVAVDWTGQIEGYEAAGSVYPPTLSDTSVSGVFTINTDLLPMPDSGNPPGVVSFTGSGFLTSSVHWSGGPFAAEPYGSVGSNSLSIDAITDQCTIQDSSTYVDGSGTVHQAILSLDVTGLLAESLGGGFPGHSSGVSGSGYFADVTEEESPTGFAAAFVTDSVKLQPVSVPEPETYAVMLPALMGIVFLSIRRRQMLVRATR